MSFSSDYWLWTLVVIVYFSCKDFLLSKLFKNSQIRVHPIFTILLALVGVFFNNLLLQDYDRYLNLTHIKGSIELPPFTILFLAADFIGTVCFFAFVRFQTGLRFFTIPYARFIAEILLLLFVYTSFTFLASHLWRQEMEEQTNWNYTCFQEQLAIDVAVYYYRNGKMPERLEDFTTTTINPVNKSPLIYTPAQNPASTIGASVTDEQGNTLVESSTHLLGLSTYTANPGGFFTVYHITNKHLCNGSLTIPAEYRNDQISP